MKNYLWPLISAVILLSFGCKNDEQADRERALKEKELFLQLKEQEIAAARKKISDSISLADTVRATPKRTTGYVLAVFMVSVPKLIYNPEVRGTYPTPTIPATHSVDHPKFVYCSDVIEADISDANELYRALDRMQNKIQVELTQKDNKFHSDVFTLLGGPYPQLYSSERCKILDRKTVAFNSYKEASIYKQANIGKY